MATPQTLADWLAWIETRHDKPIELGLARAGEVLARLTRPSSVPLITVAGTNGKGSTCALLESILRAAGFRTGLYTSPHLQRYTERVRIAGQEIGEADLCTAFAEIEAVRGDVPLTYFEFGTLAAWVAFVRADVDVMILEVGLGGRLDAVNLFDPDCAVLSSVALDHTEFLGDTREKIGWEKAHVFRAGRPAICADPQPPQSVLRYADQLRADLWLLGRDFGFTGDQAQWRYWGRVQRRASLGYPALRGANQLLNASAALAALETLGERLPVSMQAVRQGLALVEWPGRFQVLPGRPAVVLDVAHNPQSVGVLAQNLLNMGFYPETWAVVGMLADKDIDATLPLIASRIRHWYLCDLPGPRGASADQLAQKLRAMGVEGQICCHPEPQQAFVAARAAAAENDRIVVFGSFLTVSAVMDVLDAERARRHFPHA